MAAARQSYEEADIAAALGTTYPEGLHQGSRQNGVHVIDENEIDDYLEDQETSETLMAQTQEGSGVCDSEEPIEEQDAAHGNYRVGGSTRRDSPEALAATGETSRNWRRVSRNCPRRTSKPPSTAGKFVHLKGVTESGQHGARMDPWGL